MSIDMYVSSSKSQATSTKQMCRRQIEGCEDLQRQINDFVLNSQSLKGKAYDSARSYYGRVLYPLTRGCILLSEAVDQAVSRFPNEYQSRVDHGDLSELDLERKIEDAKRLLNQAQRIADQISNSSLPDIMKQQDEVENRLLMNSCQTTLNKLQEQLRKLRAFNASSPSIFSEIDGLKQAVNQGLAQTKSSFNIVTGTFIISKDLSWANSIDKKWKSREKDLNKNIEYTIETIHTPFGDYYQLIRNGFYLDEEATLAYNRIKLEENWELFKEKLDTTKEVLDRLSFLVGNTVKIVGGGLATITGVVGITGAFTVVELSTGGTTLVFAPEVAAGAVAIADVGTLTAIQGWNSLKDGYRGNVMNVKDRRTSETIGQEIEVRIGNHKHKIRVDIEPDSIIKFKFRLEEEKDQN